MNLNIEKFKAYRLMPLKHDMTHHQVATDHDNTTKHHWEANPVKLINVFGEC